MTLKGSSTFYACLPVCWKNNTRMEEKNNSGTDFILGEKTTNISDVKSMYN